MTGVKKVRDLNVLASSRTRLINKAFTTRRRNLSRTAYSPNLGPETPAAHVTITAHCPMTPRVGDLPLDRPHQFFISLSPAFETPNAHSKHVQTSHLRSTLPANDHHSINGVQIGDVLSSLFVHSVYAWSPSHTAQFHRARPFFASMQSLVVLRADQQFQSPEGAMATVTRSIVAVASHALRFFWQKLTVIRTRSSISITTQPNAAHASSRASATYTQRTSLVTTSHRAVHHSSHP